MFCVFCRERTFGLRGVAQRRKDQLIQGNLWKSIEKKTGRREGVSLCYNLFTSLLSNTLFIRKQNGSKLQYFLYIMHPTSWQHPLINYFELIQGVHQRRVPGRWPLCIKWKRSRVDCCCRRRSMAIPVVEFSREGYKIRNVFG